MPTRKGRKKKFQNDLVSELFSGSVFFNWFENLFFKIQKAIIKACVNVKFNIKQNKSILPKPSLGEELINEMSRVVTFFISAIVAVVIIGITVAVLIFALVWPKLPALEEITRYEPVLPMKVYTKDRDLIKEFGVERREFSNYDNYPQHLIQALVSAEDKRYFNHFGFDPIGLARALYQSIKTQKRPKGTSTITQQLARWFYLTQEKTIWRKFLELLLAIKIEQELTKEKILEVYMNQIYLGERSFGFSSAARTYFNKDIKDINIEEAALLASLPKFPSINPFTNPKRVLSRRAYVLNRMYEDGYITKEQKYQANQAKLPVKKVIRQSVVEVEADYVAEMARLYVMDLLQARGIENYEEYAYAKGFQIITTIDKDRQKYARQSLQEGLIKFELNHGFRGEEKRLDQQIINSKSDQETLNYYENEFSLLPKIELLIPGVLIEVNKNDAKFYIQGGEYHTINLKKNRRLAKYFNQNQNKKSLDIGSLVRFYKTTNSKSKSKKTIINYRLTNIPKISGAMVAISPKTGEINALVGGFDFEINKFNNAVQAWRQPGSTFKPFIYSAALDLGIGPGKIYEDVPIEVETPNGEIWQPGNYDNTYDGTMSVRQALVKSKNSVTVQIMHEIQTEYVHRYIGRFGFDREKIPPVLSIALGSGEVTPLQMARAYSVFANGGYLIQPLFISQITDSNGNSYFQNNLKSQVVEENLTIDPRNAYIINNMLNDVATYGTAAKARRLGRLDIGGKTGTTNDYFDTWFCGYQPTLAAVVWMGYQQPQKIGRNATGGRWALPIWIDFMKKALVDVRTETLPRPDNIGISWGDLTLKEFEAMDNEYNMHKDLIEHLPQVNNKGVTPSRIEESQYQPPNIRFY